MSHSKDDDKMGDPEAQLLKPPTVKTTMDSEYSMSTTKKAAYLLVYFLCNVSLTIYNKLVLGKVRPSLSFTSVSI